MTQVRTGHNAKRGKKSHRKRQGQVGHGTGHNAQQDRGGTGGRRELDTKQAGRRHRQDGVDHRRDVTPMGRPCTAHAQDSDKEKQAQGRKGQASQHRTGQDREGQGKTRLGRTNILRTGRDVTG